MALPKSDRRVDTGEKGLPIARVDLGSMGWMVKPRRMRGELTLIYVLYPTGEPLAEPARLHDGRE